MIFEVSSQMQNLRPTVRWLDSHAEKDALPEGELCWGVTTHGQFTAWLDGWLIACHWLDEQDHILQAERALTRLRRAWPEYALESAGSTPLLDFESPAPPLLLRGTAFQRSVWAALLEIPFGTTTTYSALATRLGKPGAARAVGSAVGANPVAVFVPCHRVLAQRGGLGGYAWGLARKQSLLDAEGVRLG